jgi:predicted GNAT family acetyltransferase
MKGDIPVLTNGHCRLAAVRLAISEGADIKGVPVRVEERQVDDARRTLSLLTRNAGKPLSMIEQAIPVRRLLDYGWSDKEIAAKAGFSLSKVKDLIALCGADTEVKEMIDQGKVSPTTVARTIRKRGHQKAKEVLKDAVQEADESGGRVTLESVNRDGATTPQEAYANGYKDGREEAMKNVPQCPPDVFNDGFHAGVVHALAILIENSSSAKDWKRFRELLIGQDKIKLSVVAPSDRRILEGVYSDV